MHSHTITPPPPCLTEELLSFGSWALPVGLHTFFSPSLRFLWVSSVLNTFFLDVQQLLVVKEEVPWSSSVDQQNPEPDHIKEEEEELWTSQESEFNGFTFTGVAVKNEGGEDKRLLQIKTEDNREAEPPTSSSGPEPARNPDPNSHLQLNTDEKALKVFETDVSIDDDDDAWQEPWSDSEPDGGDAASESKSFADVFVEETTRRENLSRNGRTRTAEKRLSCSICTKVFTRLVDLKRHRRVHPEEKPFDCGRCGKRFRIERALNGHMRIHTGEKPFSCDVCGRSFMYQYILTSHQKIHSRERPPSVILH
ncbi:uncharacterized protein [Leuresthes tenuis]|uniref:uncharacterized protein n=1 Tax=Leuresthes tenuis TaxID=355514 RepID=UPI003B51010E